jgi:hypothetical protein
MQKCIFLQNPSNNITEYPLPRADGGPIQKIAAPIF